MMNVASVLHSPLRETRHYFAVGAPKGKTPLALALAWLQFFHSGNFLALGRS